MQQRKVRIKMWDLFSPIVLKIVIGLVVETLVLAVFYMKHIAELTVITDQEMLTNFMLKIMDEVYSKYSVEMVGISAIAAIPFLALMRMNDKKKEAAIGMEPAKQVAISKYIFVICMSIPVAIGLNNLLLLSDLAEYSIAYQEAAQALYAPSLTMQIICLGILTPIMEELIFRGLIMKRLARQFSARKAIVTSAFVFGLYHGNVVQMIYGVVCGLLLGYLYEKYGSIKAPILAHMLMNIVACMFTEADVFTWMFSESMRVVLITSLCAALASTMFLYIQRIETENS